MVANPKDGMPVFFSIRRASPGKSVPIIMGIGVPHRAMNLGCSSEAARQTSFTSLLSSPIMASISVRAEM